MQIKFHVNSRIAPDTVYFLPADDFANAFKMVLRKKASMLTIKHQPTRNKERPYLLELKKYRAEDDYNTYDSLALRYSKEELKKLAHGILDVLAGDKDAYGIE